MTIPKQEWVAVVGPGALGMLLAASLRSSGREVAIVGRNPASLSLLRRQKSWFQVGNFLPRRPGCAAIFLCVKAPALKQALRSIRGTVGPDTAVVSLLNGVTHVGLLRKTFGQARAVFGACYIAALRTGPVSVRHMGGRLIHLAAFRRPPLERAKILLENAGWEISMVRSVDSLLWTKAVFNAAINPLGALIGATNGEMANAPPLAELLTKTAREAASIARKAGHKLLYPHMERLVLKGCLASPLQMNSMAQDLAAGRRTEADAILKPILQAARRSHAHAPLVYSLYRMVTRLEKQLVA